MKERPTLMSAPMVRSLLNCTKSQTRRVVKPRKDAVFGCLLQPHELAGEINAGDFENCPYGQPGDRLWVREAWAEVGTCDPGLIVYRADYPHCVPRHYENVLPASEIRWKPSIHMFRRHSRINLEITGVRVERLQDISEADAIAEGVEPIPYTGENAGPNKFSILLDGCWFNAPTAVEVYRVLWESINGDGSWATNPWVWVVEFKRVMP